MLVLILSHTLTSHALDIANIALEPRACIVSVSLVMELFSMMGPSWQDFVPKVNIHERNFVNTMKDSWSKIEHEFRK